MRFSKTNRCNVRVELKGIPETLCFVFGILFEFFSRNCLGFQSAAPMPQIGPKSVHMMCQICGNDIYSKTSKKAKSSAWWSCLLLCIIG